MIGEVRELARRRDALAARSAVQRAELAGALHPLVHRLETLDRVVAAVRHRPVAMSLAAAALALLGPRRLLHWAVRALPFLALLRRGAR
jgi:hypothetical protein